MTFDRRITPARSDLAAKHLQGRVTAERFVEGERRVVAAPQAPLRRAPAHDAPLETEALSGEGVTVYETTPQGWCWAQLETDGYVGWMPADALAREGPAPTHRVNVPRTLAFPSPSIKTPPARALPFAARVAITRNDGPFAVTAAGDYLPARHLVPVATTESDFVAVAERFLGAPYLWGGKTALGIDCSGLVQVALGACGFTCPRDSDMQERALGAARDPASVRGDLRRGDLVFWKGHVAVARDRETLLHANAFHMAVAVEPLSEALARIAATDGGPTAIRRL
jgi:cell wall-associated NlpC family hydrolase